MHVAPVNSAARRRHARGQSLAEFVITLPIMLLLTMIALDFGRVYLGWINLQNMTRIAANFAANHPDSWTGAGNASDQATYRNLILNDAQATNCTLPVAGGQPVVPPPTFPSGTGIDGTAVVGLTCNFGVITPVISAILGNVVHASAESTFPIKTGMSVTGGSTLVVPNAAFSAVPTSGTAPLTVAFTDQSGGGPTSWAWDFDGDTLTDATTQDYNTPGWTYNQAGTYTACLTVSNSAGTDPTPACTTITVSSGTADFRGDSLNGTQPSSPPAGDPPLDVQFTDLSTGGPITWAWDFDNDGTVDDTTQNPIHTYPAQGSYSVKLTVTYPSGPPVTVVKTNYVTVNAPKCTVPDFTGQSTNAAPGLWSGAGFSGPIAYKQGGLPWIVQSQSLTATGRYFCTSGIRLSKTSTP